MPASLAKLPQIIASVGILFTPVSVGHVLDPVSGVQGPVVEGLEKRSKIQGLGVRMFGVPRR